jgi:hypothetical protein
MMYIAFFIVVLIVCGGAVGVFLRGRDGSRQDRQSVSWYPSTSRSHAMRGGTAI